MHMTAPLLAAGLLLALAPDSRADVLKVPAQYPSIQAAVDAAGEGDVIKLKKNIYIEEVVISGKTDLTIKGVGSQITGPPSGTGLTITDSFGVTVIGLGVSNMGTGIVADGAIGLELRKCKLTDLMVGIWVMDCDAVQILKCRVEDIFEVGMYLGTQDAGVGLMIVKGCKLLGMGDDAIRLQDCKLLSITKCKIQGFRGDAIVQEGLTELTAAHVENNIIHATNPGEDVEHHGDGIRLSGHDITIRKNKINLSDDGTAISVRGSDITVEQNKITGAGAGIQVAKAYTGSITTGVVVLDNKLKNTDGVGIVTDPDTLGTVVQGNKVTVCFQGMLLWGTAHQIIANTVKAAEVIGIDVYGGVITLSGNVATGSGSCDFRDLGTDTILDGNFFPSDPCQ